MKNFKNAAVRNATKKTAHTMEHIDERHALTAVWVYALTWSHKTSFTKRRTHNYADIEI